MTLERDEKRVEWCQLVFGAVEDFSYDPQKMKEEFREIIDDDKDGILTDSESFFMIVKEIFDDNDVHQFFLKHIQENAPENLEKIFEVEPKFVLLLDPKSLTNEQKMLACKVKEGND